MDAQRAGGAAQIAVVLAEGGDDELPLELSSRLSQRHAAVHQDLDDLAQPSVEVEAVETGFGQE